MIKIGFFTPYKHLPNFSKLVESKYECLDLTKSLQEVDYIFAAPNYIKYKIDQNIVDSTKAKAILTPSTGYNHIEKVDIPVYGIKGREVLKQITTTAEHALYLILAIVRKHEPLHQLSNLTLGILGYGRLGKILENIGKNIFKNVVVKDLDYQDKNFFSDTDILSINIDLNDNNIKYVDQEFIDKFNKNIFIVNTARGEVVNENDILNMLGFKINGYATDVVTGEHSSRPALLKTIYHPNLIVTNHIGGTALEAQELAYTEVLQFIYD